MKADEFKEFSMKIGKVLDEIDNWEIKDQIMYFLAVDTFFNTIRPIIDKYDPGKPKRFIMKRLDEQ